MDLIAQDDYYTFLLLKDAPNYSLLGKSYLGMTAVKTYADQPWNVMEQNQMVYDFTLKMMQNINTIFTPVKILRAKAYYYTKGLILPGSIDITSNQKITGYQCDFEFDSGEFSYSEVYYA